MNKGDFIYYYSKENGMIPAKIIKVNDKTFKIGGDFPKGSTVRIVKKDNCILQSDWLKENELN
jgi:(p)ppGpp synthase/HD superfamily hydrolase